MPELKLNHAKLVAITKNKLVGLIDSIRMYATNKTKCKYFHSCYEQIQALQLHLFWCHYVVLYIPHIYIHICIYIYIYTGLLWLYCMYHFIHVDSCDTFTCTRIIHGCFTGAYGGLYAGEVTKKMSMIQTSDLIM